MTEQQKQAISLKVLTEALNRDSLLAQQLVDALQYACVQHGIKADGFAIDFVLKAVTK
jgi:hypothetical protein